MRSCATDLMKMPPPLGPLVEEDFTDWIASIDNTHPDHADVLAQDMWLTPVPHPREDPSISDWLGKDPTRKMSLAYQVSKEQGCDAGIKGHATTAIDVLRDSGTGEVHATTAIDVLRDSGAGVAGVGRPVTDPANSVACEFRSSTTKEKADPHTKADYQRRKEVTKALREWVNSFSTPYLSFENKTHISVVLGIPVTQVTMFCNNHRKRYIATANNKPLSYNQMRHGQNWMIDASSAKRKAVKK